MKYVIKNFLKFLSQNITQLIGLFFAIIVLVCIITGFFIASEYGQSQIDKMQSSGFLNSMIVKPENADFNTELLPNTRFTAGDNLEDFMLKANIKIDTVGDGVYNFQLSDGSTGIGYGVENEESNMEKTYDFLPPVTDQNNELYIDFFPLKSNPVYLLPIYNDDIWTAYNTTQGDDKTNINDMIDQLFSISNFTPQKDSYGDYTQDDLENASTISKTIVWSCIVGMSKEPVPTQTRDTQVVTYFDLLDQHSIIVSPQGDLNKDFSGALIDEKYDNVKLNDSQCLMTTDYMKKNNLNVGDQINIAKDTPVEIIGTATSSVFNSLFGVDVAAKQGIWVSDNNFEKIKEENIKTAGYTYDNNYYFNAQDITSENGDNGTLSKSFYQNTLLNFFVRNSNSSLPNYYYDQMYPTTFLDDNMGVYGLNIFQSDRNDSLLSVIIIMSIFLDVMAISMTVSIISYIIKKNKSSIGILKANGLRTTKIVNSIAISFISILIAIGVMAVIISFLFGIILTSTYNTQMDINSWSFNVNWVFTIISFLSPLFISLPIIYITLILYIKQPALFLIKDTSTNNKVKLYNYHKFRINIYRWIPKINVGYRTKLATKLMWNSRSKLLGIFFFTTLTIVILFLVIDVNSFINRTMLSAKNSITSNYTYIYQDQTIDKTTHESNYDFWSIDDDSPQAPQELTANDLKNPTNLKNKYIAVGDIGPELYKKIFNSLNDQSKQIVQGLRDNNGRILIGYQYFNPDIDQLGIFSDIKGVKPLHINSQDIWKKYNYFINDWKSNDKIFPNDFTNISFNTSDTRITNNIDQNIDLRLDHYSYETFLNAPYYSTDQNNLDDLKNFAKQSSDSESIINNINYINGNIIPKLIENNITPQIIPVSINQYYKEIYDIEIGDSFFTYDNDARKANIYVIYDWLDSLQNNFIVTPYSFAKSDLNTQPVSNNEDLYNWKLTTEPNLEYTNDYLSIISTNGNYDFTNLNDRSDLQININGVLGHSVIYDTIQSALNAINSIIIIIAILSFVIVMIQTLITIMTLIKNNLSIINTLKAYGYSDSWINQALFFGYLPLILIATAIASVIVLLFSHFLYLQIIASTGIYIPSDILMYWIAIIGTLFVVSFFCLLLIARKYSDRKYPIYQNITM